MKSNENWEHVGKYGWNELVQISLKHFHIQSLAIWTTIQLRVIYIHPRFPKLSSSGQAKSVTGQHFWSEPWLTPEISSNHWHWFPKFISSYQKVSRKHFHTHITHSFPKWSLNISWPTTGVYSSPAVPPEKTPQFKHMWSITTTSQMACSIHAIDDKMHPNFRDVKLWKQRIHGTNCILNQGYEGARLRGAQARHHLSTQKTEGGLGLQNWLCDGVCACFLANVWMHGREEKKVRAEKGWEQAQSSMMWAGTMAQCTGKCTGLETHRGRFRTWLFVVQLGSFNSLSHHGCL